LELRSEQYVVGSEVRDRVPDDGQDAATTGETARVDPNRAHVAEHRVEALVGDMPRPVDVVAEPGKPAEQSRREDVDVVRGVEDRAHRRRKLLHVGDGSIGDEQKPLDRRSTVARIVDGGPTVAVAHGSLL
jgi:hypothetical protein